MKKHYNYNIAIVITLIIIVIIIISFIYIKSNKIENFSNSPFGITFESGVSGISSTGTITFKTPFTNIPMIFTQINSSAETSKYVYSVNIFSISTTGFNYAKNKAYNATGVTDEHSFTVPKISESAVESFNWFAIG